MSRLEAWTPPTTPFTPICWSSASARAARPSPDARPPRQARRARRAVRRMYGGTCPNVGCVPTKALVHHAGKRRPERRRRRSSTRSSVERGPGAHRAVPRPATSRRSTALDTVTVLTGTARVPRSAHRRASTRAADALTVTAETILINTGAEPIVPDIPGLRESRRTADQHRADRDHHPARAARDRRRRLPRARVRLDLPPVRRPGHACSRPRRGSCAGRTRTSPAVGDRHPHRRRASTIVTGAHVTEVRDGEHGATVIYEIGRRAGTRSTADAVLRRHRARARPPRAWGSTPRASAPPQRGAVEVDEHLRTSQPHIFALGDVNGGPQFTYISLDDSRIVARPAPRRAASAPRPTASRCRTRCS